MLASIRAQIPEHLLQMIGVERDFHFGRIDRLSPDRRRAFDAAPKLLSKAFQPRLQRKSFRLDPVAPGQIQHIVDNAVGAFNIIIHDLTQAPVANACSR